MNRWTITLAAAAAIAGAAIGAGLASGRSPVAVPSILPPAFAGGIIQETPGRLWTVSPDGDAIYEWSAGGGNATVTRYDWNTGKALTRRVLTPAPEGEAGGAPAPVDPEDDKELRVTGVIWTPSAETRTAIINGQIVREGEFVTGKSGKLYKVIKIHQDREVQFEEQKPDDGGK